MIGYDVGARIDPDEVWRPRLIASNAQFSGMQSAIDRADMLLSDMAKLDANRDEGFSNVTDTMNEAAGTSARINGDGPEPQASIDKTPPTAEPFWPIRNDNDLHDNMPTEVWKNASAINGGQSVDRGAEAPHLNRDNAIVSMSAMLSPNTSDSLNVHELNHSVVLPPEILPFWQNDLMSGILAPTVGTKVEPSDMQDGNQTQRHALAMLMQHHGPDNVNPDLASSLADQPRSHRALSDNDREGDLVQHYDAVLSAVDSTLAPLADKAAEKFGNAAFGGVWMPETGSVLANSSLNLSHNVVARDPDSDNPPGAIRGHFESYGNADHLQDDIAESGGDVSNSLTYGGLVGRLNEQRSQGGVGGDDFWMANSKQDAVETSLKTFLLPEGMLSPDGQAGSARALPMLNDAERILPKPGIMFDQAVERPKADLANGPAAGFQSLLDGVFSLRFGNEQDDEQLEGPGRNAGENSGRPGPTGHKNDPIYIVAINPAFGTIMPTVPTPGTSARTPPLPGQRNLA